MHELTRLGTPGPTERRLHRDLDAAIRRHLARHGLDDPATLAAALGTSAIEAADLLLRDHWPLETSLRLVDVLGMSVTVQVDARPAAARR